MKTKSRYHLLLALGLAGGTAWAHPVPQHVQGKLLAAADGYTLYTYDPDGISGSSHCAGACAAVWPPYIADAAAKATVDFTLATRADGKRQWVFRGRPLYLFAGDARPGDSDGDGVNGSWHVVR